MKMFLTGMWVGAAVASVLMAPLVWVAYNLRNDEIKKLRRLHANEAETRIRLQQTYANASPSPYTIWWGSNKTEGMA